MNYTTFAQLFQNPNRFLGQTVTVCGWVRALRVSKSLGFIHLNDGSCFDGVQVVFEQDRLPNFAEIAAQNVGAALSLSAEFVLTPEAKQPFELHAISVSVLGPSSPEYPLQKKRHSPEYLRTIAHLRPRSNLFSAVFRVRSALSIAIHDFFRERNFVYVHTPIITGNDCEGAGEMFRVTTLELHDLPKNECGGLDFSRDFFQKPTALTVSGQLEDECMAMAFRNVYSFGPAFRAEHSNTQRHAAEFWMVEPEIAFADLQDLMALAQDMLKCVIALVLLRCPKELAFLNQFVDQTLLQRLHSVVESDFARVTYSEAVGLLQNAKADFAFSPSWGADLQTEHERYLTEQIFQKPVFVTDYPKEIKPFYMRQNDDCKTVAAMDLLVPGIGELIGGSQREERFTFLLLRLQECGLLVEEYEWYLDLRRFGSAPHAGFGLGFERLVMYVTGVSNIRDVLPFPRTTGNALF